MKSSCSGSISLLTGRPYLWRWFSGVWVRQKPDIQSSKNQPKKSKTQMQGHDLEEVCFVKSEQTHHLTELISNEL